MVCAYFEMPERIAHQRMSEPQRSLQIRAEEEHYLPALSPDHGHVVWDKAEGARVWDVDGREYIDFTSGVVVTNIGHSHPRVAEAVAEQSKRLLNCYDSPHPLRARLAKRLLELAGSPFDVVCFQVTGSEGIEAALRISKFHTGRTETMYFAGAYHGKTAGALALSPVMSSRERLGLSADGSFQAPYADCYRCPLGLTYPECEVAVGDKASEVARSHGVSKLAAVIAEPLLGVGGAVVPPSEFWRKIRQFADDHEALLIFDEVQSAFGRSGVSWYAFQRLGIVPDIVVAGKGIASGLPITALLTRKELIQSTPPHFLTSTYAGNPLSCAAALATIDVLVENDAPARSEELGKKAMDVMRSWIGDVKGLGDVRGMGLNIGLDLVIDIETKEPDRDRARSVYLAAVEEGVLVLPPTGPGGNVLRIAPPLLIEEHLLHEGLKRLRRALGDESSA